jgi:hypothetical protein
MRGFERLDFFLALPKLYVVTVNKALGIFLGGVVVGAKKLYRSKKVAVSADNAGSIFGHPRSPPKVMSKVVAHFPKFRESILKRARPERVASHINDASPLCPLRA